MEATRETAHARFRSEEKTKHLPYRMTPEKRKQLERVAEMLSEGKVGRFKASLTDALDAGLDALEEKLSKKV